MLYAVRNALLLLALGLALRLLFQYATGDRFDAHAAAFQGDAPVWQQLASKAADGVDDELFRLPLRPPGQQWLVSALWNGSTDTAWVIRLVFVMLGALVAPLVYLLTRLQLSEPTALMAGGLCAASSSLMSLGSGPHSELPYLVLVLVSLFDQERLRTSPGWLVAMRWGILHGLICLLRAEHLLTFLAFVTVLAVQRAPKWRRSALCAIAACAVAVMPWQLTAFSKVTGYNNSGAPPLPTAGQTLPGALPWDASALQRLQRLPAFQRGPVFQFVTDTIRTRGGASVTAVDLDVVSQAYDTFPEPLPQPFLCLYGGLNFFLANTPEANGGFSGAALDRPPPLAGGPTRYPPGLLQVLPKSGKLVLSYPPHLGRLVHGYRDGMTEILADPVATAGRIGRKIWHATEGAATGFGGYAVPIGLSGTRRPVDLVTATGTWACIYRIALMLLACAGLWSLRQQPWIRAWLAFAITKLIIIAAFFGYARQGALITPIVMIGIAAALQHTGLLRPRTVWIALATLLSLEVARTFSTEVTIELPDGTPTTSLRPDDHRLVTVTYR